MNVDGSLDITGELCSWSPDGRYLAVITSKVRLIVRESKGLEIVLSELCTSVPSSGVRTSVLNGGEEAKIDKLGFSPDSIFVYASSFKLGVTHIFMVQKTDQPWKAKITEGGAGLSDITFTPDSRHLLAFSDLNVKLTLWSLVQKKVRYIKYPKSRLCVKFSPNDQLLAVVERREGRDCVSLFDTKDWGLANHFETESYDCKEIEWSPKSDCVCMWSSPLEFSCLVFALDGRCVFGFSPEKVGLGIATAGFSPCGNLLVVVGCDGIVYLFNTLTWSLVTELKGVSDVIHSTRCRVFEELEIPVKDVDLKILREIVTRKPETQFSEILNRPVNISSKSKVASCRSAELKFRKDGRYFALRTSDWISTSIFVFNVPEVRLEAVVIHRYPVVNFTWGPVDPYSDSLTILTSDGSIHAWTPTAVVCLDLPALPNQVQQMLWNPKGRALALISKDKILCCRVGMK